MGETTKTRGKGKPAQPKDDPATDAREADVDEQAAVARAELAAEQPVSDAESPAVSAAGDPEDTPAPAAEPEADAEQESESAPPAKDPRLCVLPGCDRPAPEHLLGLCGAHWANRRGDHD